MAFSTSLCYTRVNKSLSLNTRFSDSESILFSKWNRKLQKVNLIHQVYIKKSNFICVTPRWRSCGWEKQKKGLTMSGTYTCTWSHFNISGVYTMIPFWNMEKYLPFQKMIWFSHYSKWVNGFRVSRGFSVLSLFFLITCMQKRCEDNSIKIKSMNEVTCLCYHVWAIKNYQ